MTKTKSINIDRYVELLEESLENADRRKDEAVEAEASKLHKIINKLEKALQYYASASIYETTYEEQGYGRDITRNKKATVMQDRGEVARKALKTLEE